MRDILAELDYLAQRVAELKAPVASLKDELANVQSNPADLAEIQRLRTENAKLVAQSLSHVGCAHALRAELQNYKQLEDIASKNLATAKQRLENEKNKYVDLRRLDRLSFKAVHRSDAPIPVPAGEYVNWALVLNALDKAGIAYQFSE